MFQSMGEPADAGLVIEEPLRTIWNLAFAPNSIPEKVFKGYMDDWAAAKDDEYFACRAPHQPVISSIISSSDICNTCFASYP